jgi:hypothetical protein
MKILRENLFFPSSSAHPPPLLVPPRASVCLSEEISSCDGFKLIAFVTISASLPRRSHVRRRFTADGSGAIVIAFSSGGLSPDILGGIIYFHLFNDKTGEEKSFVVRFIGLGFQSFLLRS